MAFGKHWEWRGFGTLDEAVRGRLEALPRKFPTRQRLGDEYLFGPGCRVNVKLRQGDLKFKRLLDVRDGLERWLEDETENYPFPLTPEIGAKLARELGLSESRLSGSGGFLRPLDRPTLIRSLQEASQGIQVITVVKDRLQLEWGGGPGKDATKDAVTVEIAEIDEPEKITSVSLEHPERERLAAALEALDLRGCLKPLNYLEALEIWARGETLST